MASPARASATLWAMRAILMLSFLVAGCSDEAERKGQEPAAVERVSSGRTLPTPPRFVTPTEAAVIVDVDRTSAFLRTRKVPLAVDRMSPLVLSPLTKERFPPPMPRCKVEGGGGTYDSIRAYLDEVGDWKFAGADNAPVLAAVSVELEKTWKALRAVAAGDLGEQPLRVMFKHYPREDLEKGCYTIHTAVFTLPDPFFDNGADLATLMENTKGKTIPGLLLEMRQTYRVKSGAARMIEAGVEANPKVTGRFHRNAFAGLLQTPEVTAFTKDAYAGGHFHVYGGGERVGIYWCDRSMGKGEPKPWGVAYRATRTTDEPRYDVKTEALSPENAKALREIVSRS